MLHAQSIIVELYVAVNVNKRQIFLKPAIERAMI